MLPTAKVLPSSDPPPDVAIDDVEGVLAARIPTPTTGTAPRGSRGAEGERQTWQPIFAKLPFVRSQFDPHQSAINGVTFAPNQFLACALTSG